MPPVARNSSGHRQFDHNDLNWVAFVSRLKQTGMPLDQIRHYAELRAAGDITIKARKELLQAHAHDLEQRIDAERHHLIKIRDKIRYYETL